MLYRETNSVHHALNDLDQFSQSLKAGDVREEYDKVLSELKKSKERLYKLQSRMDQAQSQAEQAKKQEQEEKEKEKEDKKNKMKEAEERQRIAKEEAEKKRRRDEEEAEVARKKQAMITTKVTLSRPPLDFIAALDATPAEATALWNALPEARHAPALSYIRYSEEHRLQKPFFPAAAKHVSGWIASEAEHRSHMVRCGVDLKDLLTTMLDGLESWHTDLGFGSVVTQRARAVVDSAAAWWG